MLIFLIVETFKNNLNIYRTHNAIHYVVKKNIVQEKRCGEKHISTSYTLLLHPAVVSPSAYAALCNEI